jgi:aspartate racemase
MSTSVVKPHRDGLPEVGQDGTENVLGVVGGLGPLVSAEFLKTIYEQSSWTREQEAPRVLLYSDPTFLDRTEALLNGADEQLLNQLVNALTRLCSIGASRIVISCVTIHHLLPRVPSELRARLVSLVDVIFDELSASGEPHLLLCSNGTRELRIFEGHRLWPQASGLFVLPDDSDQREIHRVIYRIKQSQDVRQEIPYIETLLTKYHVNAFIAGCTEFHLLAKHFATSPGGRSAHRCIDPLMSIARALGKRRVTSAAALGH